MRLGEGSYVPGTCEAKEPKPDEPANCGCQLGSRVGCRSEQLGGFRKM